jgi:hypothetical protein
MIDGWSQVAQDCNPSYSAGRDWEDHCLNPAPTNSSGDPILTKKFTNKSIGGMAHVLKKK